MKLAMVGLGKMGGNISRRLVRAGHQVVVYDRLAETVARLAQELASSPAGSLEELVSLLDAPVQTAGASRQEHRIVWVMVPAGDATEMTIASLAELLSRGDIVIDGGNSNFRDSMRRAEMLKERGVRLLDVGVSGGIWGLEEGYSLMVGGEAEAVDYVSPILADLASERHHGWGHVGPSGAGHFVKMVHNGIEYALMEAYAEGFELMRSREDLALDLAQVAQIWRHGSVVRSWLLDLIALALEDDPELSEVRGWVADSGEGRWTVIEGIEDAVPLPVIAAALFRRFSSRQEDSFAMKLLASMRNQFGGHPIKRNL